MNMLTFSKQRHPEMELSSIPMLVQEVGDLMKGQFQKRGVQLNVQIVKDMPPIPADTASLHQSLLNLLVNALEAIDRPKGGQVTLGCGYDEQRNCAMLIVADNGHGIDREGREQLFKPFYSTKGLRGTGLGLAVTKKVIDEHHGTIEVRSAPGKGTMFTVRIPGQTVGDPGATH
jgi:signal transduction histidine kinase